MDRASARLGLVVMGSPDTEGRGERIRVRRWV